MTKFLCRLLGCKVDPDQHEWVRNFGGSVWCLRCWEIWRHYSPIRLAPYTEEEMKRRQELLARVPWNPHAN